MSRSNNSLSQMIRAHREERTATGRMLRPSWRRCLRIAFAGVGFLALSIPAVSSDRGRSQSHESSQASGVVLKVEATQITLQAAGTPLTLTTFEDYREEVPVGTEVTAWYYPQDTGTSILKSLSYPLEGFFVPASEIGRRVRRTIVLPNSDVPDADGLSDSIRDYLQASLGWYVAPPFLAEEIRRRSERADSTLDAIDPATGSFDLKRYLRKTEAVIPKIATESRVDSVLEVDVQQVQAPVSRLVADWDGNEEGLSGAGIRTLAKLSMFSRRGEVSAATAVLKLWDARGQLLWRNRRGLALLEVLDGRSDHLRERPLPDFLGNTQAVQAWLDSVFKSLLPEAHTGAASPQASDSR